MLQGFGTEVPRQGQVQLKPGYEEDGGSDFWIWDMAEHLLRVGREKVKISGGVG
jgi:hypothetical protein